MHRFQAVTVGLKWRVKIASALVGSEPGQTSAQRLLAQALHKCNGQQSRQYVSRTWRTGLRRILQPSDEKFAPQTPSLPWFSTRGSRQTYHCRHLGWANRTIEHDKPVPSPAFERRPPPSVGSSRRVASRLSRLLHLQAPRAGGEREGGRMCLFRSVNAPTRTHDQITTQ